MTTNPKLRIVPNHALGDELAEGSTRVASKDQQEILTLLKQISTIGNAASAFAPFVNPYREGALINVADVITKDETKGSNPTIMFTVLKGAFEVGRHDKNGEFVQYAVFHPQSNNTSDDTILFSPEVKLKKLSIRALENDTLVMMIKKDRFVQMLGGTKHLASYRKFQETMFNRVAEAMPIAKGYRYDIFFLRHLSRLFVKYILKATVSQDRHHIDFLTKKLTELLDEFNMFKTLKLDQQVKVLAKFEELKKTGKRNWIEVSEVAKLFDEIKNFKSLSKEQQTKVLARFQELQIDGNRNWIESVALNNTQDMKDVETKLGVSIFNLHQDLLDMFFDKDK